MGRLYTDDEMLKFANNWNKLPKYSRKFIEFLLDCNNDESLEYFAWIGNFSKLCKLLAEENYDVSNFRKQILPIIEKGIIIREDTTRFNIKFILPLDWKTRIINLTI